jgi:hypothetical protein
MAMSDEEKVAKKIGDLISDLRLDLDYVAFYIKQISPNVAINRILLMADLLNEHNNEEKQNYDYDY